MSEHELCDGGIYELAHFWIGKQAENFDLSCDFSGLMNAEDNTIYHQYIDTEKQCYIRS